MRKTTIIKYPLESVQIWWQVWKRRFRINKWIKLQPDLYVHKHNIIIREFELQVHPETGLSFAIAKTGFHQSILMSSPGQWCSSAIWYSESDSHFDERESIVCMTNNAREETVISYSVGNSCPPLLNALTAKMDH